MTALVPAEELDRMESIIEMHLKSVTPTQIAKRTGIPRSDVINLIERWKEESRSDSSTRDMSRDLLLKMIEHYDKIIAQSYDLIEELRGLNFTHQVGQQIGTILKNISDFEHKRLDIVQKAGILENNDLGDDLVRMEEEKEMVIGILRNDLCSQCRPKIMRKIAEMSGRAEVVVIQE